MNNKENWNVLPGGVIAKEGDQPAQLPSKIGLPPKQR